MNTLMSIYNDIRNPIDDDETLKKIIEVYTKCEEEHEDFYSKIVTLTIDEKVNISKWFRSDADTVNAWLFNTWKENVINMTPQQFQEFYGHKGRYDDNDFNELRNYLKSIGDVSTEDEVNEVMHESHGNRLLDEAIKKYTFEYSTTSGFADRWIYINSKKLAEKKTSPVKHRLYLNTDSTLTLPLLGDLLNEFTKRNMEYLLKYSENGGRDDTVVIYANDDNLPEYVEILREKYKVIQHIKDTKEGYSEIYNIYSPPIMTGKIDGWIGYGSEPELDENGNTTSYNKVREQIITDAISSASQEWIFEHQNMVIPYDNKMVKFSEYFSEQIVNLYIKKAKKELPYSKSKYKNQPEILDNNQLRSNLVADVKNNISQEISDINAGKDTSDNIIALDYGNGVEISFTREDVKNTMNRLSVQIMQQDPSFLDRVRNKVRAKSNQYGIDEESFCFDASVVARLKKSQLQPQVTITLDDCIAKIKGLEPSKLSDAYKLLEMLELGEIDIGAKGEID